MIKFPYLSCYEKRLENGLCIKVFVACASYHLLKMHALINVNNLASKILKTIKAEETDIQKNNCIYNYRKGKQMRIPHQASQRLLSFTHDNITVQKSQIHILAGEKYHTSFSRGERRK